MKEKQIMTVKQVAESTDGIGAGLFESDFYSSSYVFLPITFYLAKPLGGHSRPITGNFGGPVLFHFGYQYPGIAYVFVIRAGGS